MKKRYYQVFFPGVAGALFGVGSTQWCYQQDPVTFPAFFSVMFLFWAILATPFVVLGLWARRRRLAGKRNAGALRTVSSIGLAAVFLFVVWRFWCDAPFHDAIIARGVAPDGRDYVVSRAWMDWADGHSVHWFAREKDGRWRSISGGWDWHVGSRIAEVVFDEPYPVWHSEGTPFFRLSSGGVRYLQEDADHPEFLPASMTPEDLHEWHRKKLAEMRFMFRNQPKSAIRAPATNAPAPHAPAPHADSAEGAKEPAP